MAIGRRVATGALALVATFGLLSAGAAVARQATVTSPVASAMHLAAVTAYQLDTASPTPAVTVRLVSGVDLESVCQSLDARLAPVFGQAVAITPVGPGQTRLRGLVEALAVPVAQGIATGQFVSMASSVRRLAATHAVRADVEIDGGAVYVTLVPEAGGGSAYALFPRPAAGVGSAAGAAS